MTQTKNKIKIEDEWYTFSNYKQPLKKLRKEDGYGFYGVLLITLDGERIQCHICGKNFQHLGTHVTSKHKIKAKEYKATFELSYRSALVSESMRQRLKEQGSQVYNSLSPNERKKFRENAKKGRENRGNFQPTERLESKNKKGTCPDQLLQKIQDVADDLGHVPSLKDFVKHCGTQRYKHLIFKTFGSWSRALEIMNLQQKQPQYGYSKEALIQYLQDYQKHNKVPPSTSDCDRGLLPSFSAYKRQFGSMVNARRAAGLQPVLSGWERRR
jgi:hypothetical protein